MSASPVIDAPSRKAKIRHRWTIPVHVCRVVLFVGILILIRQKHVNFHAARPPAERLNQIGLYQVRPFSPDAKSIEPWDASSQSRSIHNQEDKEISRLIQTSPVSDAIVGYLGPTNLMIAISPEQRILHVDLLESADTVEHVRAIIDNQEFLSSYIGHPWNRPHHWPTTDAVSGATLTSFAVVQSLASRAGLQTGRSKFPNQLTNDEINSCFGTDLNFEVQPTDDLLIPITNRGNDPSQLGFLIRTSPTADSIVGYQGPTDCLLVLDQQMRFTELRIRNSYDNEPYVEYVKSDSYLNELLAGKSLAEIAAFPDGEYEGVSGATMTSLGVWNATRLTASEVAEGLEQDVSRVSGFMFGWRDSATIMVGVVGILFGLTRLRRRKRLRLLFQAIVIVYLGFVSGDMLSQALLVGWTQNGLPTSVAPGLIFLAFAALAVPIFSKRNIYCNHVCPAGAIQQLTKNRINQKLRLSGRVRQILKLIPGLLVILVLLTALGKLDLNLASIEAFDAFSFRVAGWTTICVALVGLIASLFVPMAYCKYGCPSGAVLEFLRFNSDSGRIAGRDFLAVTALALGMIF